MPGLKGEIPRSFDHVLFKPNGAPQGGDIKAQKVGVLDRFGKLNLEDCSLVDFDGYPNLVIRKPMSQGGDSHHMLSDSEHQALEQLFNDNVDKK